MNRRKKREVDRSMKYTITVNEVKESNNSLKGFATVVFGNAFKITNIAIMGNSESGQLFVSMPRYKTNEKDENQQDVYQDICNPITKEFREELYGEILKAFEERDKKNEKGKAETPTEAKMPEFSVRVVPYTQEDSNVIGFARIYFEDCFVVNNVTVIQGKENAFVSMPSYKTKEVDENNKPVYRDICYPVTKEFREKLYGEILEMHQLEKEKRQQEGRPLNRRERMQKEMQEQGEQDKPTKAETKQKKGKGK